MKKYKALLAATMIAVYSLSFPYSQVSAGSGYDMNISVNLSGQAKEISPYIFGINQYDNQDGYKNFTANAIRQGGNRMTAYNWENNASNAGSDWKHSSDDNLSPSDEPADCVQKLSAEAAANDIGYKLATLQMGGYVAADKKGTVSEAEAAPSDRWNKLVFKKTGAFDAEPDLTDGVVYMDEYVNYIVGKLGDSTSASGIQAYSLDNEPALWSHTHSRMHPESVTIKELSEKSIELAAAVKAVDPKAEIFGPSLYGYTAFDHLADDDTSDEWETIKSQNGYNWYLDSYLDDMAKAEKKNGKRLLDVLDIHYYSESSRVGVEDRLQSVRTLYEKDFAENSWIGQWCQANIPILPTVQKSIDTYYPGTKLAISEYNFGGAEDISGTIAQAEALGCFADAGVYFASLWGSGSFLYSGINLYTNYDGKGGSFGDSLIPVKTDDVSLSSSYAAINGKDKSLVTAMVTNKSMTEQENAVISLENAGTEYEAAAVYAVYGESCEIRLIDIVEDVKNNKVEVELPALSAAMVVITDDASEFDGLELYDENKYTRKTVTFDDLDERINQNGYIEVPVDDPEHLKSVILTADVTSSAGSGWGTAGCALSINAKDKNGTLFWTSKSFNLTLGKNSSATVAFDGTFINDDVEVEAVIADNKIEIQKWWEASEKQEEADGDVISVEYTSIQLVYEYEAAALIGDIDGSGKVDALDLKLLQKHIIQGSALAKDKLDEGDLSGDGKLSATDASALKRILLG